jgi:hypothetical protein
MAVYENTINDEYPGVCGTISYLPPEAILALDYKDLTYRRCVTPVGYLLDC